MKWLLPDEIFPTFDDDVDTKELSKEDVYNLCDYYDRMSSAKLTLLFDNSLAGGSRGAIIENVLLNRGLNVQGLPLSKIEKETAREFGYHI